MRLMVGITSALEMYQKIIKDVLMGCKGVANIADDLIIHGRRIEKHEMILVVVVYHQMKRQWQQ